jgi:hypothetical protein
VFSSVEEMAPWIGHLLDPRPEVGGKPRAALMRSRGVLNSGDTLDYASGLVPGEERGLATLGHVAAFLGYRAAVQTRPEAATGVVVLCNRADARPSGLAGAVGAVVPGDRMEPPEPAEGADVRGPNPAPETRPVQPDEVTGFAGTFQGAELDAAWTVRPDAGGLRLHLGGVPGPILEAEAPEVLRGEGIRLRYQRDARGAVTGFRADAGRVRNLRFVKVTPGG